MVSFLLLTELRTYNLKLMKNLKLELNLLVESSLYYLRVLFFLSHTIVSL